MKYAIPEAGIIVQQRMFVDFFLRLDSIYHYFTL